jgi:hypothetical protein
MIPAETSGEMSEFTEPIEFLHMVPVQLFRNWDYSDPKELFCKNHPNLKWIWKGPGRNLHYVGPSDLRNGWQAECSCPFGDLLVHVHSDKWEWH